MRGRLFKLEDITFLGVFPQYFSEYFNFVKDLGS
jgi:hypothetical protein